MITIQDGQYYSLGQKTFAFFVLQNSTGMVGVLLLGLVLGVIRTFVVASALMSGIAGFINAMMGGVFIVAIILEIAGVITARLKYNTSRVMLDDTALHIVKGIVSKSEVAIPYRRLQSIAIKQSLLYRIVGVGHVVITTTTDLEQPGEISSEADDEVVPLMDYDLATAVAGQLTKRAEVERMQVVGANVSAAK
ncbi:MAG: PH domain-containing protein [Candidatus Paceibacterota bacterium]|jgi:uncharacterized membrane protein YdbT with pleckstrin-like domain